MLSRVADSIYWTSRYVERAEDTARIVRSFTDLVAAQRRSAWADVARRIAHEIKNPLTPIQLSAERIRRRYGRQLSDEDRTVFDQCTETIVRQVGDIRRMVDEFSAFARMPKPVIAERAQYWPDPAPSWYEAHNSFGVTAAGEVYVGLGLAGHGLPAIEPGMPVPAGTGLTRRSFLARAAGLALRGGFPRRDELHSRRGALRGRFRCGPRNTNPQGNTGPERGISHVQGAGSAGQPVQEPPENQGGDGQAPAADGADHRRRRDTGGAGRGNGPPRVVAPRVDDVQHQPVRVHGLQPNLLARQSTVRKHFLNHPVQPFGSLNGLRHESSRLLIAAIQGDLAIAADCP